MHPYDCKIYSNFKSFVAQILKKILSGFKTSAQGRLQTPRLHIALKSFPQDIVYNLLYYKLNFSILKLYTRIDQIIFQTNQQIEKINARKSEL